MIKKVQKRLMSQQIKLNLNKKILNLYRKIKKVYLILYKKI